MTRPHPPGEGPGRNGAPSGGNLPGHRPGSGRHSLGRTLQSRTRARSIFGTKAPKTVAALPERRMQREKTPNEAPEGAT
jgi:hypothetical protein